MIEICGGRWEC